MNYDNIPQELKRLPNWVVANEDKIPYNPAKHGERASVVDPATWGTFEQAVANRFYKHIGFVLSEEAGFTIIDLDNKEENPLNDEGLARHAAIMEHFQSYAERSASGRGYHIILKGTIPSGVHRDSIEMYSSGRYMICTGDKVNSLPISDAYQESLTNMYGQMKPAERADLEEDAPEEFEDFEIVDKAMAASNGDKFNSLCAGDISEYPSQSEADLALLSIIAFYSKNNEQVRRIFRMSALGKREKAIKNDVYLNYAIGRIRANQAPDIDFSQMQSNIAAAIAESAPIDMLEAPSGELKPPEGLIGEVAAYIFQSSVRPVPEIALAAAIAFIAGICQRQYNTHTRAGLNQYLILLAGTGRGKEGAASGVDRLLTALRTRIPAADIIRGPAAYSSGVAIIKSLNKNPCLLSILGEFGMTLQRISNDQANAADKTIAQALLDIYGKSGSGSLLGVQKYSQAEKDSEAILSPALTILGETTPETFLDGLTEEMIAHGLIPRFTVIEYKGERPYINPNAGFEPPTPLVDKLASLMETVFRMQVNNSYHSIPFAADSLAALNAYDRSTTDYINTTKGAIAELWNRAHLKVMKLASLVAVGRDWNNPIVSMSDFLWAKELVERDIYTMTKRFENNDVGVGDGRQIRILEGLIQKYYKMPNNDKSLRYENERRAKELGLIPKAWLQRNSAGLADFRNDRLGATNALNRGLAELVDMDKLASLPNNVQLRTEFGSAAKVYLLGSAWK